MLYADSVFQWIAFEFNLPIILIRVKHLDECFIICDIYITQYFIHSQMIFSLSLFLEQFE